MKGQLRPHPLRRVVDAPFVVLALVLGILGVQDTSGLFVGLSAGAAGLVRTALWRLFGRPWAGGIEVLPAAGTLVYLSLAVPPTVVSEILAGLAGVFLLLWLAHTTARPTERLSRVLDHLVMPLAGLAIALGASFVIPVGPLSLGLASLLLVLVVVFAVLVLTRPAIVGRREAPTS